MNTDLQAVATVLAQVMDAELRALIGATCTSAIRIGPASPDWTGITYCNARGRDRSVIDAFAMRSTFAQDAPAVRALFDALAELLTGGERKH